VVVDQEGSSSVIEEIVPKAAACAESFGGSPGHRAVSRRRDAGGEGDGERRQEFTAGRECARSALSALGVQAAPILRGYRGAPQWPDGIVGQHRALRGYCAAAVAGHRTWSRSGWTRNQTPPSPAASLS